MPDTSIRIGSSAPDVTLQGERDEPKALGALWSCAEQGIVLGFLRHYG